MGSIFKTSRSNEIGPRFVKTGAEWTSWSVWQAWRLTLLDHAHAIHRRNLLERLDGAAVQVLVGVEHGVGVLASGLVGHTLHVGVVLGENGRDLADHVGHVGMQAGNAACGARLAQLQAG